MASKLIIRPVGGSPLSPMASEGCSGAAETFHCPRVGKKVAERYGEVVAKWPTQVLWLESRKCFCYEDKPQVDWTYTEASSSLCLKMAEMWVCMPIQGTHSAFLLSGVTIRGQCDRLLWPSGFLPASLYLLSPPQPLLQARRLHISSEYRSPMYPTRPPCWRSEMILWGLTFHYHVDKRAWSFQQLRGWVRGTKISF